MFAKLLKHEWRATWGVLGLLCVIILASGAAIGCSGFYITWIESQQVVRWENAMNTICFILLCTAMMAIGICCAGGILYLIWRFYQRCFTDEGFLTFTLPVNTHQILLSSAANTICGSIVIFLAGCGAVILAMGFMVGILLAAEREAIIWADVFYSVEAVWEQLVSSLAKNWENLLMLLGSGAVNWIAELMVIMLAVTMGCILAKKHRFLMGVASYYGIQIVLGLIPLLVAANGRTAFGIFEGMTQIDFADFMAYSMLKGLATGAVCYFAMHFLVNRKLNLN